MSCFGRTYTKIGTIQRRLAWPLRKDDTQNREAFHIFCIRIGPIEIFVSMTFFLMFIFLHQFKMIFLAVSLFQTLFTKVGWGSNPSFEFY
jgi:hypothetical protein